MPSYSSNAAMRSGLDAQVSFISEFARRSYHTVRKLSELNLHFAQQIVQDSFDASQQLLSCTDPFQIAATSASAAQPAMHHVRAYQQQLIGLLTGAQRELTRTAGSGIQEASRSSYDAAQELARQSAQAGDAFSAAFRPEDRGAAPESHSGNGAQHLPG